jgi:LmbE family N-acetylglucosaminyl deacetylase
MTGAIPDDAAFEGDILVIAPHMDDETLGCGITLAQCAQRQTVRVVFATDGARSPEPRRRTGPANVALTPVREAEAVAALDKLGVPRDHVEFLGFPDGELARHQRALADAIVARVRAYRPEWLFVPFRYDHHPDHLALNRAATAAHTSGQIDARLVEYFVYARLRLLRTGDLRDYVADDDVVRVYSESAATRKRAALACYRTQTTCYFPWQRRPILERALIDRVCGEPETLLIHDPARRGARGLARARRWVPLACRVEPTLKRWKDRLVEPFTS